MVSVFIIDSNIVVMVIINIIMIIIDILIVIYYTVYVTLLLIVHYSLQRRSVSLLLMPWVLIQYKDVILPV